MRRRAAAAVGGRRQPLRVLVWQRRAHPHGATADGAGRRAAPPLDGGAAPAPRSVEHPVDRRRRHLGTRLALVCVLRRPTVRALSVAVVPLLGGAVVTLRGDGFAHADSHDATPVCAFGDAAVPATRLAPDALRCIAHDGWRRARAPAELRVEFGLRAGAADDEYAPPAAQSARRLLLGVARQSHGELRLSSAASAHAMASAWVLPRLAHPPLTHFTLRFDLLMGGGSLSPTPADGMKSCTRADARAVWRARAAARGGAGLAVRLC